MVQNTTGSKLEVYYKGQRPLCYNCALNAPVWDYIHMLLRFSGYVSPFSSVCVLGCSFRGPNVHSSRLSLFLLCPLPSALKSCSVHCPRHWNQASWAWPLSQGSWLPEIPSRPRKRRQCPFKRASATSLSGNPLCSKAGYRHQQSRGDLELCSHWGGPACSTSWAFQSLKRLPVDSPFRKQFEFRKRPLILLRFTSQKSFLIWSWSWIFAEM